MLLTKEQIEDMRTSLRLGAQPFTKEAIDSLCALALKGLQAEGAEPPFSAPQLSESGET